MANHRMRDSQSAMGDVFAFTAEDLSANAEGRLTERQRERLAGSVGRLFGRRIAPDTQVKRVEGPSRLTVHEEYSRSDGGTASIEYYSLYINDLHFKLNQRQYLALRNGSTYRIYYVPDRMQIVSVVPLTGIANTSISDPPPASTPTSPAEFLSSDARLKRAFTFTEDDLKSNQKGRLSERQQRQIARQSRQPVSVVVTLVGLAIIMLAVGSFVAPFLILPNLFLSADGSPPPGVFLVLCFGIPLVVFVFNFMRTQMLRQLNLSREKAAGTVQMIEGVVQLNTMRTSGGYGVAYRVKVGGTAFIISIDQFQAFDHGLSYRLYYLPRSRTIVAAEPIEDQPVASTRD